MKSAASILCLLAVAALAGGCTSIADVMRPGPEEQAQAQQQAYQDLSMPPDLRLPPPGSAPQPAPPPEPSAQVASVAPATPYGSAPAAAPQGDIYERNGMSKVHPDGTPKTDAELQAELKKIYLAKKQQKNPKYGTVFNIGNIFKDE